MKTRYYFGLILAGLVAGAWWDGTQGEPARKTEANLVALPTKVQKTINNEVSTPQAPVVAPHQGSETVIVLAEIDPQTDLKTAIPDIVKRYRAGDMMYSYLTPAEQAKLPSEEIQRRIDERAPTADPTWNQSMQKLDDAMALSYEALEKQIPAMNAAEDEATYAYHQPTLEDMLNGTASRNNPVETLTFIRIDGRWYVKPKPPAKISPVEKAAMEHKLKFGN